MELYQIKGHYENEPYKKVLQETFNMKWFL